MGIPKRILGYSPAYRAKATENPSLFREGEDVIIVLTPVVGWGFGIGSMVLATGAAGLLYLAALPMNLITIF